MLLRMLSSKISNLFGFGGNGKGQYRRFNNNDSLCVCCSFADLVVACCVLRRVTDRPTVARWRSGGACWQLADGFHLRWLSGVVAVLSAMTSSPDSGLSLEEQLERKLSLESLDCLDVHTLISMWWALARPCPTFLELRNGPLGRTFSRAYFGFRDEKVRCVSFETIVIASRRSTLQSRRLLRVTNPGKRSFRTIVKFVSSNSYLRSAQVALHRLFN